jgi:acyl-coenzyme A synthetase/AMP-(fatty) acid ligase
MICSEIYLYDNSPIYILCTSGTTGRQKAIVHTHASVVAHCQALLDCGVQHGDKFLQQSVNSWITHIYEILLPLTAPSPGTIVLLKPGDNLNMISLAKIIKEKQITAANTSISTLKTLLDYLELKNNKSDETLTQFRIWCVGSEANRPQCLVRLKLLAPQVRIFALYGSTEQGLSIGCYVNQNVSELSNLTIVPLGYPLLNYRCILVNDVDGRIISSSNSSQIGQIHIKGILLHTE